MSSEVPSLFGLKKTNRDFSLKETWGKNQFNSSFPASLCCYLAYKKIDANYLSIQQGKFSCTTISIENVFGLPADNEDLYFAFEAQHAPFQKYIIGSLPRTDLVIQRESTGECLAGLEVKLTALPDNTTCSLKEALYGSEIVVRPDTIVYLACSIATSLHKKLNDCIPDTTINNLSNAREVLPYIETIINTINKLAIELESSQNAFLIQPIWKTKGKSPELVDKCLDVFIWSNAGFSNFISEIANKNSDADKITRQTRAAIWLFKMLKDIKENNKFNHGDIIDNLSYNRVLA